ncbi:hypothetical protein COHA_003867 [Chlorella ohadii]|uniref:Uncharacterized protein n=1 Tax=Chlorella ohadii TaxID=2649997 RepID=A0AAD5DU29_9CHLO|nr:hypothetical protein COHA_003867 [Chlorella ohadii]
MLTDWRAVRLGTKLKLLKRLAAAALEKSGESDCICESCLTQSAERLELIISLTKAEQGDGLGTHAHQEGVRLRLALAQQTQLLPRLAASVVAAGAGTVELPEPAATKKHVAACALLGAFSGSINHIDVEANSAPLLATLHAGMAVIPGLNALLPYADAHAQRLLRAPADDALLTPEPAWDAEPGVISMNAGGRRAMLIHMGPLLCGEIIPIAQAFEAAGGFGIPALLKRPQASDINLPWVKEHVAEALQMVRDVRAALASGRTFCPCCQEAHRRTLCRHLRQARKMCDLCGKTAEEVPGGLKCCANCMVSA